MRSSTLFAGLFSLSAVVAVAQLACGGDDNGAQNNTNSTPDAGPPSTFTFPDATAGTTVAIVGAGTVGGGGSAPGDAGPQAVRCTSDGTTTTGQCRAQYQDTLYALPANGWQFDHWDLGDDAAAPRTANTYYVGQFAPPVVTAVFIRDPFGVPDSGNPTPHDSGNPGDTSTPPDAADSATPDTGSD